MNLSMLLLIFVSIIFSSVGALFLKKGSHHFHVHFSISGIINIFRNYPLIIGIFLYGLATIFFIFALRLGELSVVYPLSSLTYVLISLLSVYFLKEKMNSFKWAGICFIILGVILVNL
jgi:multidrug transporter EmrE-like cation transporter